MGSDTNMRYADLICAYFFESLLRGASTGRAALEARQKYVQTVGMSNAVNVKTIAQFYLLGDPSIAPIAGGDTKRPMRKKSATTAARAKRAERRRDLFAAGVALAHVQPDISKIAGRPSRPLSTRLRAVARSNGMDAGPILSFKVTPPPRIKSMPKGLTDKRLMADRIHVIFAKQRTAAPKHGVKSRAPKTRRKAVDGKVIDIVALVVEEIGGWEVSVEKAFSR